MKILFINISDIRGGSAIVAYRLAKSLEKNFNTKNILLVRNKFSTDPNVIQTRRNKFEEQFEWAINVVLNLIGLQYKFLPFSPGQILHTANEFKPDIINLHNTIGGYFRINDLVKLSKIAPIVWTLHDMWAFTGNAAHTLGNEHWRKLKVGPGERNIYPQIGLPTGNWLLKEKKKIYQKSNVRIITPSSWLYTLASQSPVFEKNKIDLIHHGVDLKKFRNVDTLVLRQKLNISSDSRIILFSAEKLKNNPFKGGKELLEILFLLDKKLTNKVYLLTTGIGKIEPFVKFQNIIVKNIGYVMDESDLASIYSLADLFIYPTKADSFGLVLLESIACGTPCISFAVGGCTDIILDDVSGYVIPAFDTTLFADKIFELLNNHAKLNDLNNKARKYAAENFSIETMVTKYYDIFCSLL